jgi:hypothetical protein
LQLYYYIQPSVTASSYPLAYIYHNLPPSFAVYFTNVGTNNPSGSIYIQNKNIKNNGDSIKLLPTTAFKAYAQRSNQTDTDSKSRFNTWYMNQTWGYGQLTGLSTCSSGTITNCVGATADPTPPNPTSITVPPSTTNISLSPSKYGDTITFAHSYGTNASTQAITPAGTDDGSTTPLFMNLVNIYLTFSTGIC